MKKKQELDPGSTRHNKPNRQRKNIGHTRSAKHGANTRIHAFEDSENLPDSAQFFTDGRDVTFQCTASTLL